MAQVRLFNGKPLLVGGKVALSDDCCCGGPPGECTLPDEDCPHALCWEVKFDSYEATGLFYNTFGWFVYVGESVPENGSSGQKGIGAWYQADDFGVTVQIFAEESSQGDSMSIDGIPIGDFFDTWLPMKLEFWNSTDFSPYSCPDPGYNHIRVRFVTPFGSNERSMAVFGEDPWSAAAFAAGSLFGGAARRYLRNIHLVPSPSTSETTFNFQPDSWDSFHNEASVVGDSLFIDSPDLAWALKALSPAYLFPCVGGGTTCV